MRPETLADLAARDLIGPDKARADLALVDALAAPDGDKPCFAVRMDSHPAQLAAVRAGLGGAPSFSLSVWLCGLLMKVLHSRE